MYIVQISARIQDEVLCHQALLPPYWTVGVNIHLIVWKNIPAHVGEPEWLTSIPRFKVLISHINKFSGEKAADNFEVWLEDYLETTRDCGWSNKD